MKVLKSIALGIIDGSIIGLLVGLLCFAFLSLLAKSSDFFQQTPNLVYLLPLCGFFTLWIYKRYGGHSSLGNHLIIDEIHSPKQHIPLIMAPLIFITTILSHLFGASVGREGTAIQMGGSISEAIGRKIKINPLRRKSFLIAGMGAGFSAALGVPFAGAIFGLEVLHLGRFKLTGIVQSTSASFVAYAVTLLCKAPHSHYPQVEIYFSWQTLYYLILCALIWGITARIFIKSSHLIEKLGEQIKMNSYLKMLIASSLLVLVFKLEGTTIYNGLGIQTIQQSFETNVSWLVPLKKIFFTLFSLGAGFKGGEFTPLAFIGATIGSSFASYFAVSTSLFAAVGFSALFGCSSKTPLSCTVMACELFGLQILPFAFIACFISYLVSGHLSIYKYQR